MTFVASTISEHIRHEGELIERARSEERIKRSEERIKRAEAETKRAGAEAKAEVKRAKAKANRAQTETKRAQTEAKRAQTEAKAEMKRAALTSLEELYEEGLISTEIFKMKAIPLRKAFVKLFRQIDVSLLEED